MYRPQKLTFEKVNISTLLKEIFSLSTEDCKVAGITLQLETDEDPLFVEGEAGKLKQVFLNLVKNAMEAMEKGGSLTIRSRRLANRVEISISDNGPGIQPKDREKLLHPFFYHQTTGHGFGSLLFPKKLSKKHPGGTLWSGK